jgi:hypothetical protein
MLIVGLQMLLSVNLCMISLKVSLFPSNFVQVESLQFNPLFTVCAVMSLWCMLWGTQKKCHFLGTCFDEDAHANLNHLLVLKGRKVLFFYNKRAHTNWSHLLVLKGKKCLFYNFCKRFSHKKLSFFWSFNFRPRTIFLSLVDGLWNMIFLSRDGSCN